MVVSYVCRWASDFAASVGVPPVDIILTDYPLSTELLSVAEDIVLAVFSQRDGLQAHLSCSLIDRLEVSLQLAEYQVDLRVPWRLPGDVCFCPSATLTKCLYGRTITPGE